MTYPEYKYSRSLASRLNENNPYIGQDGVMNTTADLFNATHWLNDQLDKNRIAEADKLRRFNRNPATLQMKMRTLTAAGYTPEEAQKLAQNPNFWRPEWERYGITRPYAVDVPIASTGGAQDRFYKKLDDKLNAEDYVADHRFQRQLDQQHELQDEQPALYGPQQSASPRSKRLRPATVSSGGPSELSNAVARENFNATGNTSAPTVAAGSEQMDYIGNSLAQQLHLADAKRSTARMALDDANNELAHAQEYYASPEGKANRADAIAYLNSARSKSAKAKALVKQYDDEYSGTAGRGTDYGFEVRGSTVFDPQRRKSFDYKDPASEDQLYTTPARPVARNVGSRLSPRQTGEMNNELSRLDKFGVIDLESDYYNPHGARAQLAHNMATGHGAENYIENTPDGGIKLTPRLSVGNRIAIQRNLQNEAQQFSDMNPELSQDQALFLAAKKRRGQKVSDMDVYGNDPASGNSTPRPLVMAPPEPDYSQSSVDDPYSEDPYQPY